MSDKQKTISTPVTIKGYGLHTGKKVNVIINPAPENHGYVFKRTDIEGQPSIKALSENVLSTDRGTTIAEKNVQVSTVEHLLASLYGLGIDNALIEINGPEVPILDGSSKYFVEELQKVEIKEQNEERAYYIIKEKIEFIDKTKGIEIIGYPDDNFSVDVHIDYNSKVLGYQFASLKNLDEFSNGFSNCRTFVFLHELEPLLKNNLIKGGDLENAIVIMDRQVSQGELDHLAELFNKPKVKVMPEGILNNIDLYYSNEPARHKLIDVLGDFSLAGVRIKGKIIATKPGHYANTEFAKVIRKQFKKQLNKPVCPVYDPTIKPLFDINQIMEWLPHRPPFLLIDKITSMDKWTVTGIKNVTMNESFFIGHFPEEPIMPGVLQLESMAQVGGMLLLSLVEGKKSDYLLIFMKIENVRFKQKVVPGDTLNIKMILKEPIKRGIAVTHGYAFVGDTVVAECDFMAQVMKKPGL